MRSPNEAKSGRPLSPHLQIYKPQISTMLSITHRISGIAASVGLVVMVGWLAALAGGPEMYQNFLKCADSLIGQIVLLGLSLSFFFHLCLGVRHLFWDAGYFLDLPDVYKTGRIAVVAAIVLTAIVWLRIFGVSL